MSSKVLVQIFNLRHAASSCIGLIMIRAAVVRFKAAGGRRRRFSRTDYGPARLSGCGVLHRVPS